MWNVWWNNDWQDEPKHSLKTHADSTSYTTNNTQPGIETGYRGGKPETNYLSYDTAQTFHCHAHWRQMPRPFLSLFPDHANNIM
jgi:hypothetical protein